MKLHPKFQVHGHRACRGLYPENTIVAFEHANTLGVDAIEFDVVISKDQKVIISHEPYFSHLFSTDPEGKPIRKYKEKKYNIYAMTTEELQAFDVGLRRHKDFPQQQCVASFKPTLKEAVQHIDALRKKGKQKPMQYSIEIKRKKRLGSAFHPSVKVFVDLVVKEIRELRIIKRCSLLCFDLEVLEYLHKNAPELELVYLVDNFYSIEKNMLRLSFKPHVYGPKFSLVDQGVVDYCNLHSIDIVCWTVNEIKDMKALIKLGVRGITTDYPDRLLKLIGRIT